MFLATILLTLGVQVVTSGLCWGSPLFLETTMHPECIIMWVLAKISQNDCPV